MHFGHVWMSIPILKWNMNDLALKICFLFFLFQLWRRNHFWIGWALISQKINFVKRFALRFVYSARFWHTYPVCLYSKSVPLALIIILYKYFLVRQTSFSVHFYHNIILWLNLMLFKVINNMSYDKLFCVLLFQVVPI